MTRPMTKAQRQRYNAIRTKRLRRLELRRIDRWCQRRIATVERWWGQAGLTWREYFAQVEGRG